MLLLFHEYKIDHPRFKGHAMVAYVMAMVVPVCALLIADAVGWWNPWLWSGSGVGIALALALHGLVAMHKHPEKLSARGKRMVQTSGAWFPFFFVITQGSIASLIVIFLWFSATSMALPMPRYVHGVLIIMALMIPARRYVSAHILPGSSLAYEKWREILRGLWHALATVLITRIIIGLTTAELKYITQGTIAWHTMLWVPAALYIIFATANMLEQLSRIKSESAGTENDANPSASPADKL